MLIPQGAAWPARATERVGEDSKAAPMGGGSLAPSAKLREILRAFGRRRKLIVVTLLVLNGITLIAVNQVRPRYSAEATLMIGPRQAQVLDLKGVFAGLTGDSDVIESEIQLLHSRRTARAIVEQLHLDRKPDFNPLLRPPSLFARLQAEARARLVALLDYLPPSWRSHAPVLPPTAAGDAASERDPLAPTIDTTLEHLWIAPKGHSRVISVSFDSSDPLLSAGAANAAANNYIGDQLKAKLDATAHAQKWLTERVAELRSQVVSADEAVEAYRQHAGITQGRTNTLLSEQLSALSDQVVQAGVARATAEARLQSIQDVRPSLSSLEGLPEAQASPAIQALRAQQSTLLQQLAEYTKLYGESHPRVAALRAEAAAIDGRLRAAIGKIAVTLQDEVRIARQREATLAAKLNELRHDAGTTDASEVELRILQHEADADRALYDRLLTRLRETSVEDGLQQPDAQIISLAEPPTSPSFPRLSIILPISFLASCIATVLLVLGIESLDHGFSSLEQVEEVLGLPALGLLPRLKRGIGFRRAPATDVVADPNSPLAEAIRNLYTSLMLSDLEKPPKVVLVASSLPGEGKTSAAVALARLMAGFGKRVVIVDCDLRRPALHEVFGVPRGPGLTDYLAGRAEFVRPAPQRHQVSCLSRLGGIESPDLAGSAEVRHDAQAHNDPLGSLRSRTARTRRPSWPSATRATSAASRTRRSSSCAGKTRVGLPCCPPSVRLPRQAGTWPAFSSPWSNSTSMRSTMSPGSISEGCASI